MSRAKRKLSDNLGHNILELYNSLVHVRFITSKTKHDIQYSKPGIRVASRVAEQLKTLYKKIFGWRHSLVPSLLSRNKNLAIAVKKHAKADIKRFMSCPLLLDFSILFQIFCPGL